MQIYNCEDSTKITWFICLQLREFWNEIGRQKYNTAVQYLEILLIKRVFYIMGKLTVCGIPTCIKSKQCYCWYLIFYF